MVWGDEDLYLTFDLLTLPVFAMYSGALHVKLCNAWDANSRITLKKINNKIYQI